jgi:hypothetical protein
MRETYKDYVIGIIQESENSWKAKVTRKNGALEVVAVALARRSWRPLRLLSTTATIAATSRTHAALSWHRLAAVHRIHVEPCVRALTVACSTKRKARSSVLAGEKRPADVIGQRRPLPAVALAGRASEA